jgi:hypothetical protein
MTPKKAPTDVTRRHAPPVHTPRLRLKPKATRTGYVDGAWWPRSDDLTAELPDLLAVLSVRLGPIGCVVYKLDEWAKAPKKLACDGRTVRLNGYQVHPICTLEVLGLNRKKTVLLVVSPQADPAQANGIMMAAAGPNNALTVSSLLNS